MNYFDLPEKRNVNLANSLPQTNSQKTGLEWHDVFDYCVSLLHAQCDTKTAM